MPQYQKERERVRQQQLQRVGKSGAIATAAGRAADYLRAEAAKKGGDSLAYDDDGKEHDFYDPDVKEQQHLQEAVERWLRHMIVDLACHTCPVRARMALPSQSFHTM